MRLIDPEVMLDRRMGREATCEGCEVAFCVAYIVAWVVLVYVLVS
jgi:hypothetical protein